MRPSPRLTILIAYLGIAWVVRYCWPGLSLWGIPLLSAVLSWIYVVRLRGRAWVAPLVVFALNFGLPSILMGRRLWPLFHAWKPVGRQILQIFAAQWPYWLRAALLPVVLALLAAILAVRHVHRDRR